MSERKTVTTSPEQIFVSRTREMDRLKQGLGHAMSDEGRMIMLVDEPGIGKKRTAGEFAVDSVRVRAEHPCRRVRSANDHTP